MVEYSVIMGVAIVAIAATLGYLYYDDNRRRSQSKKSQATYPSTYTDGGGVHTVVSQGTPHTPTKSAHPTHPMHHGHTHTEKRAHHSTAKRNPTRHVKRVGQKIARKITRSKG